MDHEGKALAADEVDAHHERIVGIASVHVRAVVTWLAIFPLVALGMCLLSLIGPRWNPVLRALVLTLIVVPTTVYFVVPRLLSLYTRAASIHRRKKGMRAMKRQLKANQ